jgi:hypothetical protein
MSRGDCGAYEEDAVGFLRRKLSNDLVLVHPDNISNNDWVILLEAGTIIGPTPQRIRVARWMQEKKIVKKYDNSYAQSISLWSRAIIRAFMRFIAAPALPPRLQQARAVGW